MRRPSIGIALGATVVALALLLWLSSAASAGSRDSGCRAYGDGPRSPAPDGAIARLSIAGEFHCKAARSLAVEVCAARLGPGAYTAVLTPIWCIYRTANVAAGGKTFVRTPNHVCTVGRNYVSMVRILGAPWDQGPAFPCRIFA